MTTHELSPIRTIPRRLRVAFGVALAIDMAAVPMSLWAGVTH